MEKLKLLAFAFFGLIGVALILFSNKNNDVYMLVYGLYFFSLSFWIWLSERILQIEKKLTDLED